ncbi:hypothetical protein N8I77_008097 [Diaporthe amygdali]|uniref:Uncharacterized protein n=1 Tax=Phomopsis amygdali TaxID=1214568 RepID=A0AAD9SFR4_PHOAM|nr:hypothetical protein N8I77_008097 [Diaporthe amygdali]
MRPRSSKHSSVWVTSTTRQVLAEIVQPKSPTDGMIMTDAQPEIDRFQDNGAPVYPLFIGEIREYKQAATNEETVKVLEHANQSRKENPKGIKPWRARDDPNWLTTNG